ncbi:MAG: glycerophosphodiester phosphodiesterase [Candidatus Hodarchaeota archaeon]
MVQVTAHRGLSHDFPENTLLAFQKAVELGVDVIELDVRLSGDKKIIVSHDSDLIRCARKPGNTSELDYDTIKSYNLGMGQHVPILEDVLDLVKDKNVVLNIEIKEYELEQQLVSMIKRTNTGKKVMFSSFLHPVLMEIRDLLPEAFICSIFGSLEPLTINDLINQVKSIDAKYINLNHTKISPDIVEKVHNTGLGLTAWTIDSVVEMQYFIDIGVDNICTNEAERLMRLLGRV